MWDWDGFDYFRVSIVQDLDGNNALHHRSLPLTKPDVKDGFGGKFDAPDDAGYQVLQMRGCITIKNGQLGYVSVLPIGMA